MINIYSVCKLITIEVKLQDPEFQFKLLKSFQFISWQAIITVHDQNRFTITSVTQVEYTQRVEFIQMQLWKLITMTLLQKLVLAEAPANEGFNLRKDDRGHQLVYNCHRQCCLISKTRTPYLCLKCFGAPLCIYDASSDDPRRCNEIYHTLKDLRSYIA